MKVPKVFVTLGILFPFTEFQLTFHRKSRQMECNLARCIFNSLSLSLSVALWLKKQRYKNKCFYEYAFKFPIGNVNFAAGSYMHSLKNRLCNMFHNAYRDILCYNKWLCAATAFYLEMEKT